ncbi:MAG: hypothetical protein ACR2IM_09760, partial [Sediminibacterium sp.]
QIQPDGRFEKMMMSNNNETISIGQFRIKANLNINEPAHIQIYDQANTFGFVSNGTLLFEKNKYFGTDIKSAKLIEKIDGKIIFKEALDEMPAAMKKMIANLSLK